MANETTSTTTTEATKKKSFGQFVKKYPVFLTALLGLLAVTAVYFWKDMQGRNEKAAVEKMATAQIEQNLHDMLRLMSKPLIWSIRSEMLRGNIEQVNIFTTDLVKEKNFQYIHLIDPNGNIIVSTDKKLEGQSGIGMFDNAILQTDSVMVFNSDNNMLTLAAPVMGYDKRLATVILKYKPARFVLNTDNPSADAGEKKE